MLFMYKLFLMIFSRIIVPLIVQCSLLFFRICREYDDCGSFCFKYRVCSLYLCCSLRFFCPIYDNLHVLQVSLHSPLISWSCELRFIFGFVSYCNVLEFLKTIARLGTWKNLWFTLLMEDNILILPRFSFLVVHCLSGFCRYVCVLFGGLVVAWVFEESYCFVRVVL